MPLFSLEREREDFQFNFSILRERTSIFSISRSTDTIKENSTSRLVVENIIPTLLLRSKKRGKKIKRKRKRREREHSKNFKIISKFRLETWPDPSNNLYRSLQSFADSLTSNALKGKPFSSITSHPSWLRCENAVHVFRCVMNNLLLANWKISSESESWKR